MDDQTNGKPNPNSREALREEQERLKKESAAAKHRYAAIHKEVKRVVDHYKQLPSRK